MILHDLAYVSGWKRYSLHDLAVFSCIGYQVCASADPAQHLTTTSEELDDLRICRQIDHDLTRSTIEVAHFRPNIF